MFIDMSTDLRLQLRRSGIFIEEKFNQTFRSQRSWRCLCSTEVYKHCVPPGLARMGHVNVCAT